jgi:hypothetical protein
VKIGRPKISVVCSAGVAVRPTRTASKCSIHPAVLADVIGFRPEAELGVAHLAIERVAAMALVDQHEIVLVDRRDLFRRRREQHALDQTLDSADVDLGGRIRRGIAKHLEPEDVSEAAGADDARAGEGVLGLVAQRRAVHHEADPPEPLRVEQAIQQRDR